MTGCIAEDRDGCDDYVLLTFHYENSTARFDEVIGNDVRVYFYQDDQLCQAIDIPYSEISGGKTYRLKRQLKGGFRINAWAVGNDGNKGVIPSTEEHAVLSKATIGYRNLEFRATPFSSSSDGLYLGMVDETGDSYAGSNKLYVVPMKYTLCKVKVIADKSLFDATSTLGTPAVYLNGCASEESLTLEPLGAELAVPAYLDQNIDDQTIATIFTGLMPSHENKTISVTAYSGEHKLFTVESDEISVPGKEIVIVIKGQVADIHVNGWRVKTTSVIFN